MGTMPSTLGKSASRPDFFRSFRNEPSDGAGAVHRGENADVVACSHSAILTWIAEEGPGAVNRRQGSVAAGVGIILCVVAHAEVMNVYVFAGRNIALCLPDDLSIPQHVLTRSDRAAGDLVALWNGGRQSRCRTVNLCAGFQWAQSYDHIIRRVKRQRVALV